MDKVLGIHKETERNSHRKFVLQAQQGLNFFCSKK